MKKILHIYSGGLDSTVLLYYLLSKKYIVECLGINYGQKHKKELNSAQYFCKKEKIKYDILDLKSIGKLFNNNVLTTLSTVPEGHYASENMKKTVVPNRNMIMLSIAAGMAIDKNFDKISFAGHAGDHTIYPDCRPDFVRKMNFTLKSANWNQVSIFAPFIYIDKTEIVKIGNKLSDELYKTWSCYNGRDLHCGKCGTCVERKEAFKLANIKDLTKYE